MMRTMLILCFLAACGDGGSSRPDAPAVVVPDAPIDTVPPDSFDQCNMLVPPAMTVAIQNVAMDAPMPQGGTVVPGSYVLTTAVNYRGTGGTSGPTGQTLQAMSVNDPDGTHFHYVQRIVQANGMASSLQSTGTYAGMNTTLTVTNACPDKNVATYGYDASPTGFALYQVQTGNTLVLTFAKQ